MEIFFSVANTILLIILFFYQRNRNKVLSEQLAAQQQLINETKSVVTQQATALQSQSKVVESALQYSQSFDPEKLESILRREFEVEHKEEIEKLKDALGSKNTQSTENTEKIINMLVDIAANSAAEVTGAIVEAFMPHIFTSLMSMPPKERNAEIELFPDNIKEPIRNGIQQIERKISESNRP